MKIGYSNIDVTRNADKAKILRIHTIVHTDATYS